MIPPADSPCAWNVGAGCQVGVPLIPHMAPYSMELLLHLHCQGQEKGAWRGAGACWHPSRHFAGSWEPDLETRPVKLPSPPLTQFASIGKPCTAHALALYRDANPPCTLKGGWGFLQVLHDFSCSFLWIIIHPTPQLSGRGCSARRAAHCRTSPHQSDTFVSGLYGDAPFLLAMLEQTWVWLCAPLLGAIYFSVEYLLNPVVLPFDRASFHCSSTRLWQPQPGAGLGDTR